MPNQPNKHHFLPEFYLKQWSVDGTRFCEFSKPYSHRVTPRRTHAGGTGYIMRLYAIEGLPENEAVEFERAFLSPVDSRAAQALKLMRDEHAAKNFDPKQREAWAGFLTTLMSRMPEDIRKVKEHVKGDWLAGIPELQEKYREHKAAADPEHVLDFIKASEDVFFEKGAFEILKRIMAHKTLARQMMSYEWSVLTVERSKFSLLTSDRPLLYTTHMTRNDSHILVPISPHEIFLAVGDRSFANHIKDRSQTDLVRLINAAVVGNADKYVYGVDDRQLRFVQNRMGAEKAPTLVDRLHAHRLERMKQLEES
jgi:hypothetical protein